MPVGRELRAGDGFVPVADLSRLFPGRWGRRCAARSDMRPARPGELRCTRRLGCICAWSTRALVARHTVELDAANVSLAGVAATSAAVVLADTELRPELVSRRRRFRSERSSDADWQRISRSFSSALLMTSSSLGGKSGFRRVGGAGARFRIASVTTPVVSPRKGSVPVAIS